MSLASPRKLSRRRPEFADSSEFSVLTYLRRAQHLLFFPWSPRPDNFLSYGKPQKQEIARIAHT
jgi:hypothetical protein